MYKDKLQIVVNGGSLGKGKLVDTVIMPITKRKNVERFLPISYERLKF